MSNGIKNLSDLTSIDIPDNASDAAKPATTATGADIAQETATKGKGKGKNEAKKGKGKGKNEAKNETPATDEKGTPAKTDKRGRPAKATDGKPSLPAPTKPAAPTIRGEIIRKAIDPGAKRVSLHFRADETLMVDFRANELRTKKRIVAYLIESRLLGKEIEAPVSFTNEFAGYIKFRPHEDGTPANEFSATWRTIPKDGTTDFEIELKAIKG